MASLSNSHARHHGGVNFVVGDHVGEQGSYAAVVAAGHEEGEASTDDLEEGFPVQGGGGSRLCVGLRRCRTPRRVGRIVASAAASFTGCGQTGQLQELGGLDGRWLFFDCSRHFFRGPVATADGQCFSPVEGFGFALGRRWASFTYSGRAVLSAWRCMIIARRRHRNQRPSSHASQSKGIRPAVTGLRAFVRVSLGEAED